MKKKLWITALGFSLFVIGFVTILLIPKHEVIRSSSEIALLTQNEVINRSELIIRGKINKALPSEWSNPNNEKGPQVSNQIQTDIPVDIIEVYKGIPNNEKAIIVRQYKGQVGDTTYIAEDEPELKEGDEVILCLYKGDDGSTKPDKYYYRLIGYGQGKYEIDNDAENIQTSKLNTEKVFKNMNKETFTLSTIKDVIAEASKNKEE